MASWIEKQPKTSNEEEEDCMKALQLTSSSVFHWVFHTAIKLDLFNIIAKAGPHSQLSASEIAAHLPTQNPEAPDMLDRILLLLATNSLLTCSLLTHNDGHVQRLYGLSGVGKYFIPNEDGVSFAPLLIKALGKWFVDAWYELKDAILEGGKPFNRVHGIDMFEYLSKDPKASQLFNTAMLNYSTIIMKKILETYKGFEDIKELIDVGGGIGATLNMITSKYPKIKGINFDLAHVIEHALPNTDLKHVAGDMFASVPKGETIIMKWILHNWDDEHCLKLLKNCHEALPDHGKVIVLEGLVPLLPETSLVAKAIVEVDMIMLTHINKGKERMEKEYEALAKGAGFTGFKLVCCAYNTWVMEFYKN